MKKNTEIDYFYWSKKMHKKFAISFLTLFLIVSCFKNSSSVELKQNQIRPLINQFLHVHAKYTELNNTLSQRTLENYIKSLDYGKYYFYQKDIDKIMKYKLIMDDLIADDNINCIYDFFSIYKKRFNENMKLASKLIDDKFNFNIDEKIIVNRDTVSYAKNIKEMRNRWRKSIKLQLLNYMSVGMKLKRAKKKLHKKYELLTKRTNEITRGKLNSKFLDSFARALDPHSNYLTYSENEDFRISMELKLEGIGARLTTEDGFVTIDSVIPGGAAFKLPEKLKLKPKDKIIAVAQGRTDPINVIDMSLRDVVKKIRGPKGTLVRLIVLRKTADNKTKRLEIPIVREEIKLQDSDASSELKVIKFAGHTKKIGYIKLPSFYEDMTRGKSSALDLKILINKLINKGAQGIILDLRGNPGGLLNEAIDIVGLFIDKGPVVQIKNARRSPRVLKDRDTGIFYNGPLVVLVNKFSASASEILAGAIKDYKRGLIIGPDGTYGKGTVQTYNVLPHKLGAIKVTTHIFYQPSGTSNQLNGIQPDIKIPSIASIWGIGENKSKYALKWEKIQGAYFKRYNKVNRHIINVLRNKSSNRISSNKKFQKLIKTIRKLKRQIANKTISLKEESKIEKQKKKEIEKTFKNKNKKGINLKKDLFLNEAFKITSEYINLLKSQK